MTFASSEANLYLSTDGGLTWALVRLPPLQLTIPSYTQPLRPSCLPLSLPPPSLRLTPFPTEHILSPTPTPNLPSLKQIDCAQAVETPHEYQILDHGGVLVAAPYFHLSDSILFVPYQPRAYIQL